MFDLNTLLRKNISELEAYAVWRDDYLEKPGAVFLDNCENNFGSPIGKGYERYPSSSQTKLRKAIAAYKELSTDNIITGNGSDELIDLLMRCFCEPKKDAILICEPTFGMYRMYAQLNNLSVLNVPLNHRTFLFDETLILETLSEHTKLIFICSPNNPTGTSISNEQIQLLAKNFDGLLIVDEAYIDFSDKPSALTLMDELPNLVVLQTFSKAWGLAALRVGVMYAHAGVIGTLNKVRPPFNISSHSQEMVIKALENHPVKDQLVEEILKQKQFVKKELLQMSFVKRIVESDANYFLIEVEDAGHVCKHLLSHHILISNRTGLLNCQNHIRVSIGTEEENIRLLNSLKSINK
jgi:histidinol-phosphate aminotransferase